MYSTHNVVTAIDNIDKLHTYLLRYNTEHPFATSPLCSTPVTVQLIIIDLLHFLFIVLEVLVILLTLCVFALLIVICRLQELSL